MLWCSRMKREYLTAKQIARRLHYSDGIVYDWINRGRYFPPFPKARAYSKGPTGLVTVYDFELVTAWYERTHIYRSDAA